MATAALDSHASAAHHYSSTGLDNKKIGIWAFIGSECLFFASLISTYLIYKGHSITGPYPHEACNPPACATPLKAILNIPVTSMSTFVLLMSSLFMVLAHSAVVRGDRKYSKLWLAGTALAGATFLGFQAFEFTSFVHEGLKITTNLFGSSFFVLTGFHGAHVTAGVIWLITLLF
ncbi:MAG: cytochrome c oxidase subunit 3, partial [Gemmatimonadaceae bacterium]